MTSAPPVRTVTPTGDRKHVLRALGDLAAAVAQELRAPVFGIASAAQLLRFRAHDDPVLEKSVGKVLRDTERLNRIISGLLDYGRPAPVKLAPGDPDEVWDRVLEHHRGTLESRSLVLNRTRPPHHTRIPIDREQLSRAFDLLLANAAEAAPEASDIQLSSEVDQAGVWECRLANRGAPVPPDAIDRIFDLFYTTREGAAGVGLAVCQRIIAEHNGTITFASDADATRVTVALPAA